ncbi:DUF4127 family protein [Deinococcus sp.]|uniref:DUF4127 family protein n=1 Tax=Deinococcus sp. TaxID=47478 RepID=UPI0025D03E57|nr:DUF4127 family protein [Deinococcus sp.]
MIRLPVRVALRAALLGALLLGPPSLAQVLVPLDSRPATSTLPAAIAALGGGAVSLPPAELLGNAQRGADPEKLQAWLAGQPTTGPLIVSLDALAYGGLVQSRTSDLSADQALARLAFLRVRARSQPTYAFITLPRSPDATNRARNLEVARQMMAWAAQGVFRELHVTWDDALPGSPAPQEAAALAVGAPANALLYPGADEVLASLVARALSPQSAKLRVEYSDPSKQGAVIKYEGVPLSGSVALHAQASGFELSTGELSTEKASTEKASTDSLSTDSTAPLTLYVYNGGDSRRSALRISALLRGGAQVAVADVAAVNQGNPRLWSDLATLRRPANLVALAAWGTPGNNIGTALAHAKLVLGKAQSGTLDPVRQDALLAREYANDVIYSGALRPQVRKVLPEAKLAAPGAAKTLETLAAPAFPLRLGNSYALDGASFPWARSFEWQFDLRTLP